MSINQYSLVCASDFLQKKVRSRENKMAVWVLVAFVACLLWSAQGN